jgi:Zn-dependent protease with chaperone function
VPVAEKAAKPKIIATSTSPAATLPATPSFVKPLKRWSNAQVASRAMLAVLMMVLFYGFSLAVIALLLLLTWVQIEIMQLPDGGVVPLFLILPPLGALAITLAIWPRFDSWTDPGRGVTEKRAPELYAMLREVSRATRQPMPRRLYLFDDINAFVANRGMFMGRAMGLGLPLFDLLTVSELRAVVAHEFGHDASRAGGLSTFVYRSVRTFIVTTEAAGVVPGLNLLFALWAHAFLRVAMPISRQQELRADEMACRVAGVEPAVSALTKISRNNPYGEIADPMPGWEQDLTETHPPLRDRIALARTLNLPGVLPPDDRPAKVLLESLLAEARRRAEAQAAAQ